MLKNLCGDGAMSQLTLCTTMWDTIPEDEGYDRFDELCETDAWNEMISKGAGTAMISSVSPNAQAEAEKIVGELIKNVLPVELAIQDEMVNQEKTVAQTGAGQILSSHIQKARLEEERKMQALRAAMRKESAAAEARLMKAMRAQERELGKLKKLAQGHTRDLQSQAELLRQGQENAGEIEELRGNVSRLGEASTAIVQTREHQEMTTLNVQQLLVEWRKAQHEMEELRDSMRREHAADAEREQQARRAHEHVIAELTRQARALASPRRSIFWWINPANLIWSARV